MKPLLKDGKSPWKFKIYRLSGIPGTSKAISRFDKLITRNANRSLKKGARQEIKNQLKNL